MNLWRAVQRSAWGVLNRAWDQTDHLVRCGDPCHDPRPHMPQGQAEVAAVVQAKVAAGLLPRGRPSKMWVGPGTGKICDGCEQPITKDDREYEFDLPGRPILRLHQACMEAWQVHRPIQGGSANSFTLDTSAARIAAVLRDGFPSGFCVACLAARLDYRSRSPRCGPGSRRPSGLPRGGARLLHLRRRQRRCGRVRA